MKMSVLLFAGIMIFPAEGRQGDRRTQSALWREKIKGLQKKETVLDALFSSASSCSLPCIVP